MSGIRRWELRAKIARRSFGVVIIIVLAVLISCGMDEGDRTGDIGGVWVPACVPQWRTLDFERVLQIL